MSIETEFRPYRVLVVEDQPSQRVAIKAAIDAVVEGCDFVEAVDLTDAESVLEREMDPFDLAVVDLKLKEGSEEEEGIKVVGIIKQILQRHSGTRVIVYTAYPKLKSACASYEAGANAYISKLDLDATDQLQKKVKELLEQPDIRQVLRQQDKALEDAKKALVKNRKEWTEKYGGKFAVVRNGEVIESKKDPHDLWDILEKYNTKERCKMGIIQVPLEEDKNE